MNQRTEDTTIIRSRQYGERLASVETKVDGIKEIVDDIKLENKEFDKKIDKVIRFMDQEQARRKQTSAFFGAIGGATTAVIAQWMLHFWKK